MTSVSVLSLMVTLSFLCLPDVTHAFVRESRAFKSNNFQRHPYKRSDQGYEEEGAKMAPSNYLPPSWLLNGGNGDLSVEELAERLALNKHLALDFVNSFMDIDGNGLISASELLPPSKRRRR